MASKRPRVTFPELDEMQPKGRHAILRSAEEVAAEEAMLDIQKTGEPASQEASIQDIPNTGMPENQNTSIQEIQNTRNPEYKKSGIPENQNTRVTESQYSRRPENQQPVNRAAYPKVTYRLSFEAVDAVEDMKRLLRRQYGIKVNLEEIAEEAILEAYRNMLENQNSSNMVITFSGIPENKK